MTSQAPRGCPTCGCPAEGSGDHHLIFAGFMNPHLLEGDFRRTVRCLDCSKICGYLPAEELIDE